MRGHAQRRRKAMRRGRTHGECCRKKKFIEFFFENNTLR